MSSEYGRLSPEELKARARQSMQRAAEAKPCVTVTEPNWKGMLDTQNAQLGMLAQLMQAAERLATKEELLGYLNSQLEILTANSAECRAAAAEFELQTQKAAQEYLAFMQTAAADTGKQVGRMSEQFSQELSRMQDTARKLLRRTFWITVIPSAVTAAYYLALLILRLI